MASFIEVQTTDVNSVTLPAGKVQVFADGSGQALPMTASAGGQQAEITGVKKIKLLVTAAGYWDVTQNFDFNDGDPPTVEPDGDLATYNPFDYEINLDPPTFHTAAPRDWIMTVHVRLSHLRDGETKVRDSLKMSHDVGWAQMWDTAMDFDLTRSVTTRLVQKFILGDAGAEKNDRLNYTTEEGAPGGTMYFLERVETPKMIVVWIPPNANVVGMWYEEMRVPINYHLFFHPAINGQWSDHPKDEPEYPFNFDSLNLAHRYLMGRAPHENERPPTQFGVLHGTNKNKSMLNMLGASGAGVIFVYPIGSNAAWMGDITGQAAALLLLQEINHFVQRRALAEIALHPIGRIGASGFSFGNNGPSQLANSAKVAEFDDKWDEIYNFDGNDDSYVSAQRAWFLRKPDKRRLRIYTQTAMWDGIANMKPFSQSLKIHRFSATETESSGGTVLNAPSGFWSGALGSGDFEGIHQVIPALFLHHAFLWWFAI